MADRGAKHLEDAVRGMEGRFDGSHMAWHALEVHPGEEPQFGMTIVRTYNSAFILAMEEFIRILYRSRERGVILWRKGWRPPQTETGPEHVIEMSPEVEQAQI